MLKKKTMTIRETAVKDFNQADIVIEGWKAGQNDHRSETEIKEARAAADSKREMVVTLLREAPGNAFHKNFYKKRALESTKTLLSSRPKQYFNHAKDVDSAERDLRDWASSVQETWIEADGNNKSVLKARVKVYDNWLWERAKAAPEQLAVSIEGRGSGKPEVIEGKEYNAIEEITFLNGVNWVDYPGNAGMGVQVLESAQSNKQEDTQMTLQELKEQFAGLSATEKTQFVKENPDLKEFFILPVDEGTKDQIAKLAADMKTMKESADAQAKAFTDKITVIEADKTRLANQLDAYQIKGKADEKGKMVEALLKASKLKENHVTETFKAQLLKVEAYKVGDKVVTEEDQVKQLIEDREKICVAETATAAQAGAAGTEIAVEEQHRLFAVNIFGIDPTKMGPQEVEVAKK